MISEFTEISRLITPLFPRGLRNSEVLLQLLLLFLLRGKSQGVPLHPWLLGCLIYHAIGGAKRLKYKITSSNPGLYVY